MSFTKATADEPARPVSSCADTFSSDDERWDAVCRRDRTAIGAFVCAVRTTGIYCRPACVARLPRRENVEFHATCAQAEQAGFRPCKRCRPNEFATAAGAAASP